MTTVSIGTPTTAAVQRSPPRSAVDDPMPAAARAKLIALRGQSADARDSAQSAHNRFADLRQLDHGAMRPEQAAATETEMNRLLAVRRAQNERHSQLESLVSTVEHWLRTLPPGVHFDIAKPAVIKPLKDETVSQAIVRVRDEIAALRQHLQVVKSAPLPKSDLKKEARTYIAGLGQLGRPKISGNHSTLSVVFSDTGYGPLTVKTVFAMQCWLFGAEMIKAIEREIDALPEPALSLSAKEKTKRLAELKANLDTIERQEEAFIEKAISDGLDILRRVDASPLAVLGIVVRAKVTRVMPK